jgi:serine/threonine-protein kinase
VKPERWQQIDQLLDGVLERTPEGRAAFLDQACAGDAALRREVESLVSAHARAGSFIEQPALEAAAEMLANDGGLKAGKRIGHYEILGTLGKGGMGEVYLAHDTKLSRRVALKFLPSSFIEDKDRLQRFEQEARAASALNHPNILTIHEIGEAVGETFIATEYVDGATLRHRIIEGRMRISEGLGIAEQVASALVAAHTEGIIHRDIKPDNLMLRRDGIVKVLDFGLAKLSNTLPSAPGSSTNEASTAIHIKTLPGMVLGTVAYMSPEQARGLAVDTRTDIWSLAVVLYEMLTGRLPFEGETASDVISMILYKEPEPVTHYAHEVPLELERIISKALSKNQDERYQTSKELQIDLRNLEAELEFEAKRGSASVEAHGLMNQPRADVSQMTVATSPLTQAEVPGKSNYSFKPRIVLLGVAGMLFIAGAVLAYLHYYRTTTAINSLAVLPFVNSSKEQNIEVLSDGITDSLIDSLSQLPNMRMVAHASVFRYKGREVDAQQAARELNVQAILVGRVTQIGDDLSINAELIDVGTNTHVWGGQFTVRPTDILKAQAELTGEISSSLRMRLSAAQQTQLAKRYPDDTKAYQLYMTGRSYWNLRTAMGSEKAREYFNQAIALDPNYALAYAGVADTYILPPSDHREIAMPKAVEYAQKALAIDDGLPEAHTSLGFVKFNYEFDWAGAEREFKRAIELNPNYATAHQFYSACLNSQGRIDESLSEVNRALELDPLSMAINWHRGTILYFAHRNDEAIDQFRKTIQMFPKSTLAHGGLVLAYLQKRDFTNAIAEVQVLGEPNVELARVYALSGKKDEAKKLLNEFIQRPDFDPYGIALIYAELGDKDNAQEWLEKAYEHRSFALCELKMDPVFDGLHSDLRFAALLHRMGLS